MTGIIQSDVLKTAVLDRCGVELDVILHKLIDSTNDWSLRQCSAGRKLPFACFAENQTRGKGRRGKHWLMSPGTNIAMSLTWSFVLPCQSLRLLSLSVAMAIVKTLEAINIKDVQIKWPNDVYVSGKKIAGILIETRPLKAGAKSEQTAESSVKDFITVVIGVGLNYDMRDMIDLRSGTSSQTDEPLPEFTDVCRERGVQLTGGFLQDVNRSDVAEELLSQLVMVCQHYQNDTGYYLDEFQKKYDYCLYKNVDIIQDNGEVVSGVAQGVNENAELLVRINGKNSASEHRVFNSAEVSVKPGEINL